MIEHKWKRCLPRKSKTIQNENAITNSHLKHLIFKTTNIYIVPSFVFPTHFLFGREVVCEGFVCADQDYILDDGAYWRSKDKYQI